MLSPSEKSGGGGRLQWAHTKKIAVYVNLLSHFLSLIPLHPLHHKSSKSENVKQIMTSFDLWGPMGERLLIRSSTLTSRLLLDSRSLQTIHYKSPPSTKLLNKIRQVIVRILPLNTNYNHKSWCSFKRYKPSLSGDGNLALSNMYMHTQGIPPSPSRAILSLHHST